MKKITSIAFVVVLFLVTSCEDIFDLDTSSALAERETEWHLEAFEDASPPEDQEYSLTLIWRTNLVVGMTVTIIGETMKHLQMAALSSVTLVFPWQVAAEIRGTKNFIAGYKPSAPLKLKETG